MLFNVYLLCSYNKYFDNIMVDCPCYSIYKKPEDFIQNVIENRDSYMGCLCYVSSKRNRIAHRSIPIVIGSYVDFRIRGIEAVRESAPLWGLVILRGLLKLYSNFSTFDALSMHVRETKHHKVIDWYTYIGEDGLALSYTNKLMTWTYKRTTGTNSDWVHHLQASNPFNTPVLQSEYIKMFDDILQHPYSMNDLKHRQILNGPGVMRRYVDYDLNRRKKNKIAGCQKMSTAFETGSLFQALSKKNTFETEEWCRNYPQNYDNTMHEGRSNKAAHLLPTVIRASNAAVRNSNALSFPNDAVGFFCMLNTKDLKSAGEQNVLSDFVIMCDESDQMALFKYLKGISEFKGENILTINGYLIDCTKTWTLNDLVAMKHKFPHVTTQYNPPYVRFSTRPHIPIKYIQKYDIFVSPAEITYFNIQYPENDILSTTAKELPEASLIKTPPSKCTVSINNIKGSIAMITSNLHKLLMENSLGVTCYMDISRETIDNLINLSVISSGHDTTRTKQYLQDLDLEFNLEQYRQEIHERTSPIAAMRALSKMYPRENLMIECRKSTNAPYEIIRNSDAINLISEYYSTIFHGNYYKAPNIWNLRLRAAFGNPNGNCIEDGVVLDETVAKALPPVHYNACITVEFTFKTVKQPKDARFISVDETNGYIKDEILIGCLVTEHEVYVKNSKHTEILRHVIGGHNFYLINFLPKLTNMYDNLKVRHIYNSNSITVVITGQTLARVDVGSKVANAFGQKNVISMVTDLSDCWGITLDGRKVHAQLIYSEVSILSRCTSGQLYDMFMSNEVAFGENGTIIAPVDLVIHTLHPYTNIKIIKVKNDTLTNINGFDSQNLSQTSKALRSEDVYESVVQVLGIHGYDANFKVGKELEPIIVQSTDKHFDKPIPNHELWGYIEACEKMSE